MPGDFYAAYHVPYFSTWAPCERAALLVSRGEPAKASEILEDLAARAPGRSWVVRALQRLPLR
jgi:hypothetical protein